MKLDTTHFRKLDPKNLGAIPTEDLWQYSVSRPYMKRRLRRNGFGTHCELCGQKEIWRMSKLNLQLDHIDGNNQNFQLNNLRFLCPNCHTQTPTYCRRIGATGKVTTPAPHRKLVKMDHPYCCDICGISTWNNLPLTLQVDHINGNRAYNAPGNLRLLCFNCHTQTSTYAGRPRKQPKPTCTICEKQIRRGSTYCNSHKYASAERREQQSGIRWPPDDELLLLRQQMTIENLRILLGVGHGTLVRKLQKIKQLS